MILREENTIYAISTHDLFIIFNGARIFTQILGVIKLSRIDINAGYTNVRVFLSFVKKRNMSAWRAPIVGTKPILPFDNSRNFFSSLGDFKISISNIRSQKGIGRTEHQSDIYQQLRRLPYGG